MTSGIEFFAVMTSPNLTNVVWVKTILYSYIRPKKVKYPIPEIPDDSENKSGMDWVLPKIIGSGRVSGTRQALLISENIKVTMVRNAATNVEHFFTSHTPRMDREHHG